MKTIARFQVPEDAHLFRSFLASKAIGSYVFDEYTVQNAWYYSNAIGGVRVVVDDDDCAEAVRHFAEYSGALHQGGGPVSTVRFWPIVFLVSLFFGGPMVIFGRRRAGRPSGGRVRT